MFRNLSIAGFVCLFWLAGCANTVPLSDAAKADIRSVSIQPQVHFESRPLFSNRARAMGASLVGIAGLGVASVVSAGMSGESPDALVSYMQQHNISIPEIVRARFAQRLSTHPLLGERYKESGGEAEFRLAASWGLGQENFGPNYRPFLLVTAELVRGGQVLWRGRESLTPLSSEAGQYPWPALLASPDVLRRLYSDAADLLIGRMLASM